MQGMVSASSTHGSKNGIATSSGKVAGTSVNARKEPISKYEIDATQNDADSASRSSLCTTSRLKKYRYSAPAATSNPEREEARSGQRLC